jgi:D-aminopeptidase
MRKVDPFRAGTFEISGMDDQTINGLFEAAADATEEAIYNALCMAETMVGNMGRKVEAMPIAAVQKIITEYNTAEAMLSSTSLDHCECE